MPVQWDWQTAIEQAKLLTEGLQGEETSGPSGPNTMEPEPVSGRHLCEKEPETDVVADTRSSGIGSLPLKKAIGRR